MANNRKVVINVHSSENRAPSGSTLNYGEIAVSHSSKENAALYTKISDNEVAKFISEDAINSRISGYTDGKFGGLAEIVQDLANLTITDIQATTPINATAKAIVASSCGNTVTISHVADKTAQSGFKKLTTDTYGHVTGGENVVIGDISGLNGFSDAIKGVETKLAYSSAGTGNAVTSISVNDHTITANFGKEFSEARHKHDGSDITGGTVNINYLPTSKTVDSSSDDTTIPTSKAVHAAVSGVVNGLDKAASSLQGQFVRTVIQENGLVSENKDFITADDIKLSAVTPSSTTVKEEYALYNGNGVKLGDSIKVYKDQSLVSITLEDNDGSGKTGQYLKYTYIDVNGDTQSTYVNISSLLVEAEFKSGVTADSTGIVHGVVDSASEKFLTVGANGFKLSGVQDAINSAIGGLDSTGATSEFHAITSITITDGKITEVGQTDKINSAITSVSAETIDLSGVKNADDLKAIEALTATSGILRKTGENAWDLANVVTSLDSVASNGSLVDALTVKNAIDGVDTKLQELSGSVQTLSSTTESFSAATVAGITGLDTKIGEETARATAAENSISGNVNTLSAATVAEIARVDEKIDGLSASTESFSAATVAEIARVERKLSDDEKVIAESINQLRADVDKTQEGAGLNADGSYAPHSTANYIAGATSLDDADMKLDSALKALEGSMTGYSKAFIIKLSGDGSKEHPYGVDTTRDEVAAALAANSLILLKAVIDGASLVYPLVYANEYPNQGIVLQFGNMDNEILISSNILLMFQEGAGVNVMMSDIKLATDEQLTELSGQVQTLSGSVVSIENREQNYASAITINGNKHTVVNNSVDLGSFLSANTAHITSIQQVSNASAVTTTINYVTENGSASAATITQDLIIDCGTY